MLQFGSKHVCIEDVHIFKHCREMILFLLWIGTYCISCAVQQTSAVKDLSSLVRYDDSSLAAIRHVQSIIPVVRPRPNIRSHSVLFNVQSTQGETAQTSVAKIARRSDAVAKFLRQFQQCNSCKPAFKFNRQVQSFTFFVGGSGAERHTRSNEDRRKLEFSYPDITETFWQAPEHYLKTHG